METKYVDDIINNLLPPFTFKKGKGNGIKLANNEREYKELYKKWILKKDNYFKNILSDDNLDYYMRSIITRDHILSMLLKDKDKRYDYRNSNYKIIAEVLNEIKDSDDIKKFEIDYIEHRWNLYIPPKDMVRNDYHLVKELIHYKDGRKEPNLRLVKNFKRPVWVTKELFRNHEQKKEFEKEDKTKKIMVSQSKMVNIIARELGREGYQKNNIRDVRDSPYIYGVDIDSRVFLSRSYKEMYNYKDSPMTITFLDIEADPDSDEIYLITIIRDNKIRTYCNRNIFLNKLGEKVTNTKIKDLIYKEIDNNMPEIEYKFSPYKKKDLDIEILIYENEMKLIEDTFKQIHRWNSDILYIWNIKYDIKVIEKRIKEFGYDVADIFSHPSVPKPLRRYKFIEGQQLMISEAGVETRLDPAQQWHTVYSTSSFYVIDGMCAYVQVRAGSNKVPGGYGLDNILKVNGIDGKLKYDIGKDKLGKDWHVYMVKHHPIEYVVYNIWDTLAMAMLELKNKDVSVNLKILAGDSSFDKFNSGPKKIVDKMFFDVYADGYVMGTKPKTVSSDKILGLSDWIVTLNPYRIDDLGYKCIKENCDLTTNIKPHVYDLDAVSSYPSNTVAANLSMSTTKREVISIGDFDRYYFTRENLNIIYGSVNALRYVHNIHKFPTLLEMENNIKKRLNK